VLLLFAVGIGRVDGDGDVGAGWAGLLFASPSLVWRFGAASNGHSSSALRSARVRRVKAVVKRKIEVRFYLRRRLWRWWIDIWFPVFQLCFYGRDTLVCQIYEHLVLAHIFFHYQIKALSRSL